MSRHYRNNISVTLNRETSSIKNDSINASFSEVSKTIDHK